MTEPDHKLSSEADGTGQLVLAWRALRQHGPSGVQFWLIALLLGVVSGCAAVGFRMGVEHLQSWVYDSDDPTQLHSILSQKSWYIIVFVPLLGGLVVGCLLSFFTGNTKVGSVADVIESAALHEGRLQEKRGWVSPVASLITLSTGGSTGREGPVVHLAGLMASWISRVIRADGITGRDLLGCAVAAAVSASFNAPIAGALFALEVVLRHFAVHAFAPITIAAVAGTVINRMVYGDVTEFNLPISTGLTFYEELPAFLLLGLLCGVLAIVMVRSIFWADDFASHVQKRLRIPDPLRPAIAGGILGVLALWSPHIIGVGYETTSNALTSSLFLHEAIVFLVMKMVAVAITVGGRMGGGIFSPSLMIGALAGLAFGLVASTIMPSYAGETSLYALAGMGAVSGAVLGAPISTTLIVFEMTGDWHTGLAVMIAVSMSSSLAHRRIGKSFFLASIARKGLHLAAGPQSYLLTTLRAETFMRSMEHPQAADVDECWRLIEQGVSVGAHAKLDQAMPIFERSNAAFIPVVKLNGADAPPELWGALYQVDALKAVNRALSKVAEEEHG